MLFMYIHTHTAERCTVNKMDENAKMFSTFQEEAKKTNIKIMGSYVAPHEHTFWIICDASDLAAMEKAVIPLTLWGNARMVPILTMEQAFAIGK
jgi:uncharacterized protein with GYD domain